MLFREPDRTLPFAAALGGVAIALSLPTAALANNGLNLIGFGAESTAMGGADIGLARDTSALNTNPAGLASLRNLTVDQYIATSYNLDNSHADRFGNNQRSSKRFAWLLGGGIAAPLGATALTIGVGLFVQGGAGASYRNLHTAFGTDDDVSAAFGIVRLTPGIAWQVTERWRVGLAAGLVGATGIQRVFPGTSVTAPAGAFFGAQIDGLQSQRFGARLGAQYAVTPTLTIGAAYAMQVNLPLSNGRLTANMSAIGLGNVRYSDVRLSGLATPREVGLGAAWQLTDRTLLSIEASWLNWSRALRTQRLVARNPDNSAAPAEIDQTVRLDWRNQWVFAVGIAQALSDATTLYAGINLGRNPIPRDTLNPLLAPIGDKHLTLGLAHQLDRGWRVSSSLEWQLPARVRYENPQSPFGAGAQERIGYLALLLQLTKQW
jgi:long-chain fatty acid transport protein